MSEDEHKKRLDLMLRIDLHVQPNVQKLSSLPVKFLQGYYRNPSFDMQASFNNAVDETLGSIHPVLEKCRKELEATVKICADLDKKQRESERKVQKLKDELASANKYIRNLRETIYERESELRFAYKQVQRSNQIGWEHYRRSQAMSRGHVPQLRSRPNNPYGTVYGAPRQNVWNVG